MALFGKKNKSGEGAYVGPPIDPQWATASGGGYFRLVGLDPEAMGLSGASGIFIVWHGGARPGWVYAAKSQDMEKALFELSENKDVMYFNSRGRLFVSWALIRPEYQDGVLRHLADTLDLQVENPSMPGDKVAPIPVFPPGTKPDKG